MQWRANVAINHSVGLVPTMGNLHAGHLSIVERSLQQHTNTVVTIFVNPKQFGPNEDFNRYPRTLEADLAKIQLVHAKYPNKHLIVFAPDDLNEIYPKEFNTTISVAHLTAPLCGRHRPGHFDGVTTVVYRLFSLIRPHEAYFGLKDYQQYKVIKRMTLDMNLPIDITPHEIIRDTDGLALSSRNQYLSRDERQKALHLPQSIQLLATLLKSNSDFADLWRKRDHILQSNEFGQWQYLEILDAANLEMPNNETKRYVIAGAIKIGQTRLIDNTIVEL
jgi:pantoate--beta-alanine ligase